MEHYFTDGAGTFITSTDPTIPAGYTEISQSDYETALAAADAARDAAAAAALPGIDADLYAKAQAVYDDLVGNHPTAALILAQDIDPTFTP